MSIRKMERQERRRVREIQRLQARVQALIVDLEDRQAMSQIQPSGSLTIAKYLAIAFVAFLGVLLAASALPHFVFYFLSL